MIRWRLPFCNRELDYPNVATILLAQMWNLMMEDARRETMDIFDRVVDALVENGELGEEPGEDWKLRVRECPQGLEMHVGTRSWCAYCGDICADMCYGCEHWFSQWSDPDDFDLIRYTIERYGYPYGVCQRCYDKLVSRGEIESLEEQRAVRLLRESEWKVQLELSA